MSIITPNNFNGGETNIADISNAGVQENLQVFIDEYENAFLKKLLGDELAKQFIDGLAEDPIDPKWISLRDETDLKTMLKYYIWFYWQNWQITFGSGTGEVKAKNENSNPVDIYPKMVFIWNKMVELNRKFNLDVNLYPDWIYSLNKPYWPWYQFWYFGCGIDEIYYPKNRHDF